MKTILCGCCFLLFTAGSFAQSCIVNITALKGTYNGECKKGKAEGMGTATGIDTYTGNFKNGKPDGEGKYTWKNGDWYQGQWSNGVFEGMGTLSKVDDNKIDSLIIITGFWKKGKYRGKYEKPYVVTALTNNISNISTRQVSDTKSEIYVDIKSSTSGGSSLAAATLPKPRLINIQPVEGIFEQQVNDETSSPVTNKYTFRGVKFPFHAIFTFEVTGNGSFETAATGAHRERVEIEIKESGGWLIQVNVER
jgi:hypothetical protein